tara:strand:- start:1350 stop:1535 length:186 start_codon:yes stop_codon:yes gene_type:complete
LKKIYYNKCGKEIYNKYAIDQYWKKLQKKDKWYLINIAKQRESYSDITHDHPDFSSLFKSF